MNKAYRFVGKTTPRRDGVDIVTGGAQFVNDLHIPHMLYGKVLRSPHAHAKIKKIDKTKAMKLPGVKAVLTYKDIPDIKRGNPRHMAVLDCKLRYVGDAVALVAAQTLEAAEEALDYIDVEYEKLKPVFDVKDAMSPDAPQLYDQFSGNTIPTNVPIFGGKPLDHVLMGNVAKGFSEAEIIVEEEGSYSNIPSPMPLESNGVVASWDSPTEITVWVSCQNAYMDRLILCSSLGPGIDVHLNVGHCGGSFGGKSIMYWQQIMQTIFLARAAGRPVKMYHTKEEQLATSVLRLASHFRAKLGIKKDGTVTAVSGNWIINTGAYSAATQGQIAVGCGEIQLMLRCPNWDLKTTLVCSNRPASGVVRGFGGQELKASFAPILHLAMEKADIDPVVFYKKNWVKPGDGYFWRDSDWNICRTVDYTEAIDQGANRFGWKEKWKGWLKPTEIQGSKRFGVGVGVHGNADAGEDVSEAYVKLNPSGTAMVYSSVCEHGQGQPSSLCKMVAEILQIPLDRVSMIPCNPELSPFEFGSAGSRGTYAIGSAWIQAAEDARSKLLQYGAKALNVSPEVLETVDGKIYVRDDPKKSISWRGALGLERTCLGFGRFEPDYTMPNFMAIFVEVRVDVETGKVDLVRVVAATDVGQIIDPQGLANQLHGALGTAGIDSATFEETILDKTTGRIVGANMIDYKWRTFQELPLFENVILETPFATHRFRAIGVGEITPAPGPSAVLMAVSNAIGVRLRNYPATPSTVLKAIASTRGGQKK